MECVFFTQAVSPLSSQVPCSLLTFPLSLFRRVSRQFETEMSSSYTGVGEVGKEAGSASDSGNAVGAPRTEILPRVSSLFEVSGEKGPLSLREGGPSLMDLIDSTCAAVPRSRVLPTPLGAAWVTGFAPAVSRPS